jgi:hypothetical protein
MSVEPNLRVPKEFVGFVHTAAGYTAPRLQAQKPSEI